MTTTWRRSDHLARLADARELDVLVVGGGITGSGSALDLAARGLSVALVEQADFAAGTSSRSTKLFHGGVRYLPQLQFGLISEGLREQKVLARNAAHLFEPLEFVVPLFAQHGLASAPSWLARGRRAGLSLRAGLTVYDLLGGRGRPGRRHHTADLDQIRESFPRLRTDGLRSGIAYSDAQTDDARLVVSVVKTAVHSFDAIAVNRVRVDRLDPESGSWRVGLVDMATGDPFEVRARSVLAATGAFPAPPGGDRAMEMSLSKGSHLIFDRETLGIGDRALVLPETDDGRILYIVPWLGHALVGTTDTAYSGDASRPTADDGDVAYLQRHLMRYLDIDTTEPKSTFAGLRALAVDTSTRHSQKATHQVAREHVVRTLAPRYVAVAGGKLTTYRRIAAEVADEIAAQLGIDTPSSTAQLVLHGADLDRAGAVRSLSIAGVASTTATTIVRRYGADSELVADLCRRDPDLARPIWGGSGVLAEAVFAARHESAARISDVTIRRTRAAWLTLDHARADVEAVASVMGSELGWSDSVRRRQIDDHETDLLAEGL